MWRLLLGFVLFLLWAVFARYYYVCKIQGRCGPAAVTLDEEVLETRGNDLEVWVGRTPIWPGHDAFYFDYSSTEPVLTEDNISFLEKLGALMQAHPEAVLKVTGGYLKTEKASTEMFYENLGYARAGNIADKLSADFGVERSRITLDYALRFEDSLARPIQFSLQPITLLDELGVTPVAADAASDKDSLGGMVSTFENMTYTDGEVSFAKNSDRFEAGPRFVYYTDSLKRYLVAHPSKILVVTGHTDNQGDAAYNKTLGLRRAKAVSYYFKKRGIGAQIKLRSLGEEAPIAPNTHPDGSDNPEGRAKNRRVNIIIKDADKSF